jgi:hypothetical protein
MGQTEAYTRAALTGGVVEQQVRAVEPDAEIEVAVAEQMDRQRLLWPPDARWFFLRADAPSIKTRTRQGAVAMAKTEQSSGQFPAAKKMAGAIAASQSTESTTMKNLLKR